MRGDLLLDNGLWIVVKASYHESKSRLFLLRVIYEAYSSTELGGLIKVVTASLLISAVHARAH